VRQDIDALERYQLIQSPVNLPVGALTALVILVFFVNSPSAARPTWKGMLLEMDITGLILVLAGVVCYILAMQRGGTSKAWNSSEEIGTLVGFCLMVVAFIANEWYQGEKAMLCTRILKRRTVAVGSLFAFL